MKYQLVCKCGGKYSIQGYFCPGTERIYKCSKCGAIFIANNEDLKNERFPEGVTKQEVKA